MPTLSRSGASAHSTDQAGWVLGAGVQASPPSAINSRLADQAEAELAAPSNTGPSGCERFLRAVILRTQARAVTGNTLPYWIDS